MSIEKVKQNPIQINNDIVEKTNDMQIDISTYQEVFSIITILFKKYMFPIISSSGQVYRDYSPRFQIEIGKRYSEYNKCEERIYFVPNKFIGYSYISFDEDTNLTTYYLEHILKYLYTPQQILGYFYLKLMKFDKSNNENIKGLNLALHFLKIIVENEKKFRLDLFDL